MGGDGRPKLVTISCPTHHDRLVNGLWNMFRTKTGVDHDFRWNGQSIRVHRLVVQLFMSLEPICQLDVSQAMGNNRDGVDSANDCTTSILHSLLEFLYNGRVTVGEDDLVNLLAVARELDFRMLIDAVELAVKQADSLVDDAERGVPSGGSASRLCKRGRGRPAKVSKPDTSPSVGGAGETGSSVESAVQHERRRPTRIAKKVAPPPSPPPPVIYKTRKQNLRAAIKPNAKKRLLVKESRPAVDSHEEDGETDESYGTESANDSDKSTTTVKKKRKVASSSSNTTNKSKSATSGVKGDQPLFKCKHCSHETRNKTWLQIHMARHDPTIAVFRCGSCSRQYLSEEALQHHKEVAHAGDPEIFQCSHCDYKARNKNWFQVHLSKHDASVPVFRCDLCDKPFFSQESVDRHKANHKQYKCPHCEFETPKAVSYYQHRFTVHQVDGQGNPLPRLNCSECKFNCKKRSELKYHVLAMHSGTKPFHCPQCSYVTGRKTQVNRHIKSAHLDHRPHLCDTCGRRCLTQSQLERHVRTHTGERPFKCNVCDAAFGHRGSLVSHARLHESGERPYICEICGHSFNRRYHLKVHLKNVHKTQMDHSQQAIVEVTAAVPTDINLMPTDFYGSSFPDKTGQILAIEPPYSLPVGNAD